MQYLRQVFTHGIAFVLILILANPSNGSSYLAEVFGFCPVEYCGQRPYGIIIEFQKIVYNPGDTVKIVVRSDLFSSIYLTIRDGMGEYTKAEGGYNLQNARVLHSAKLNLANQTASLEYTVPADNRSIYRYLVVASDDPDQINPGVQHRMFFSKPDADKIDIQDLKIDASRFQPGGKFSFSAKVLDGVGKPVPSISIYPVIRDAGHEGGLLSFDLSPRTRPDAEKRQYASDGSIMGYFSIPNDFPNGTYYMELEATSEPSGHDVQRSGANYHFPSPVRPEVQIPQQTGTDFPVLPVGVGAVIAGVIVFITLHRMKGARSH